MLSFLESVFLAFIKQVRLGGAQIDNLGASIPIFLLNGALLTIIGVRNARSSANHASSLIRAVIALIANPHERARSHVGIANHASPIALFAQPTDGHARLFAAKDQIRMMLSHFCFSSKGGRDQEREIVWSNRSENNSNSCSVLVESVPEFVSTWVCLLLWLLKKPRRSIERWPQSRVINRLSKKRQK